MLLGAAPFDWTTFQRSLFFGALAVFVSGALAIVIAKPRPATIGIPVGIAALAALRWQLGDAGAPIALAGAVVVLGAALEWIARSTLRQPHYKYLAVLPGIGVFVLADTDGLSIGTRIACAFGAGVTATLLADFDTRHERDGLVIPMLITTLAAPLLMVRAGVPGPVMLGSSVLMLVLLFPKPQARIGNAGSAFIAVAYWWAIALIVQGQGQRVVAAWVAFAFLLLEPFGRASLPESWRRSLRRNDKDSRWLVMATAVVAHGAVVGYAVAFTAERSGVDTALLSALPIAVGGVLLSSVVVPSPRRKRTRRRDV